MTARNGVYKNCGICEKRMYVPKGLINRTKYCSKQCANKAKGDWTTKTCKVCGKTFEFPVSQESRRVCCSRECDRIARTTRNPNYCRDCGVELKEYRAERCIECSGVARRTRRRNCVVCGMPKGDSKGVRCHPCAMKEEGERKRGESHFNWKGGTSRYYGPNWYSQRKAARKRAQYRCEICGKTKKENIGHAMDVHHIKPFREFKYKPGKNDTYKQANSLKNLAALCKSCHKAVTWGHIGLESRNDLKNIHNIIFEQLSFGF